MIGMCPSHGKDPGKKCRDKEYFAGIRGCRDKWTPTVLLFLEFNFNLVEIYLILNSSEYVIKFLILLAKGI